LEAAKLIFGSIADERSVNFALSYPVDIPCVYADPHRLLQAVSNLVSNAIKFTPAGGRVQLLATSVQDDVEAVRSASVSGVRFVVSDTGAGISAGDLAHIFDWYWQSPSGPQEGAGLGLAIARGLIEAHRSHLNVESVPGNGTTFWFTIPALNGVGSPAQETEGVYQA
jgi:signal transduction histidine kinase